MDMELFKQMFSQYCNGEIKAGYCDNFYGCENCPINKAYQEIFNEYDNECDN